MITGVLLAALTFAFNEPAYDWEQQRLPLGNGSLGTMPDGKPGKGEWQFNVDTLWSGDANLSGVTDDASAGDNFTKMGTYKPFGRLLVSSDFMMHNLPIDYSRQLDLETAVHTVKYTCRNVNFTETTFVSHPDQVMVIRLSDEGVDEFSKLNPGSVSWRTQLVGCHEEQAVTDGRDTVMSGTFANGLKYAARVRQIRTGRASLILLAADTDYEMQAPTFRRADGVPDLKARLDAAERKGYEKLLSDHIADYRSLFDRADIVNAAATEMSEKQHRLFQYGRYLLIASSRKGTAPANLQGIWNKDERPAWSSDYHTNINLQMNYWGAETTGLGELHEALTDWLAAIVPVAEQETRLAFPGSQGYAYRTSLNVFGGSGWRWNLAGAPWLALHAWDHYRFSGDRKTLAEKGYPVLKGAALFALGHLKELPDKSLVVPNGWSPEHGPRVDGVAHDQQIFSQLFAETAAAARTLGVDADFAAKLEDAHRRLAGPRIGKWGQLQEWMEDVDVKGDTHRHTSQLFAVYPGNEITPLKTPAFAKAAGVALDGRTMTGDAWRSWTWPWRAAIWARLGESARASDMLEGIFKYNILPNGFAYHPPFQLDGNFGYTGAFAECFVQSHDRVIRLLPVRLRGWESGSFRGLCARGGFVIDAEWKFGQVTKVKVVSKLGEAIQIDLGGARTVEVPARVGTYDFVLKGPAFDTLIAHRGESCDAPENTLPAYRTAVERGFGFECDIYLAKDKRLFTFHDRDLKRTTAGANTNRCTEVDWETTISKLNVGGWGKWKGSKFDPTRPALFSEVLALAREGRYIYVEVKGRDPSWVPYIADEIKKATNVNPGNVLFISFGDKVCAELKRVLPEYKVYFLTAARSYTADKLVEKLATMGVDGVDISFDPAIIDQKYVERVKAAGYSFHVWTVDNPETAMLAFSLGADTLTTNRAKFILESCK